MCIILDLTLGLFAAAPQKSTIDIKQVSQVEFCLAWSNIQANSTNAPIIHLF